MSSPTPTPQQQNPSNNNNNNNNNANNNTNIPPSPFDDALFGTPQPFFPIVPPTANTTTEAIFIERQRRQRTLRIFMMFLMLLLLMDGDEQQQHHHSQVQKERQRNKEYHKSLRSKSLKNNSMNNVNNPYKVKKEYIYNERRTLDLFINNYFLTHPTNALLKLKKQLVSINDKSTTTKPTSKDKKKGEVIIDEELLVYPRNVTGYYRGEWFSIDDAKESSKQQYWKANTYNNYLLNPKMNNNKLGISLLPSGYSISPYNATTTNLTNHTNVNDLKDDQIIQSSFTKQNYEIKDNSKSKDDKNTKAKKLKTTISSKSGRIAFQMYMKSIAGMSEIYYIDGFIKIYDGVSSSQKSSGIGISTRRDLLLRSHGLYIPSTGLISLVANADIDRSIFYLPKEFKKVVHEDNSILQEEKVYIQDAKSKASSSSIMADEFDDDDIESKNDLHKLRRILQNLDVEPTSNNVNQTSTKFSNQTRFTTSTSLNNIEQEWLNFINQNTILPFPYVPIDNENNDYTNQNLNPLLKTSIQNMQQKKSNNGNTRILPLREQALQANAASCEFEINLNVEPTRTTLSKKHTLERIRRNFINYASPSTTSGATDNKMTQPILPKELLVTSFNGIIHSPNCNFYTNITANALRIDWESTTGKAINYSFYMMLTCLTQIVVLLRQLLHTQAQSAACRVSLLCIGWQTLLDAILCIGHVLLCLMMQPLFTAFASVAFFKLLIFCVIEMKYMAIILQARYNANNAQNQHNNLTNQERMRQLIAQLHVRFYVCLFTTLMIIWYVGSGNGIKNDTSSSSLLVLEVLVLYSFWIPQIIQNIITEAKRPLHLHYIYGMTITRMIAPIYIFGFKSNFLKEVNPDFPIHPTLCFYIFVWLIVQAAVLICQGKYGARFMIPARFLPPKFDYSRPIPSSLLPNIHHNTNGNGISSSSDNNNSSLVSDTTISTNNNNNSSGTTRIRHTSHHNTSTTTSNNNCNTLDCVICYNPIDIHDNRRYMLAPCDHIFHRNCLEQWMDVKMECPICRMDLPPI